MQDLSFAQRVMQRCDLLADISEDVGQITRRFASPAMMQAGEIVSEWMRRASMEVHRDQIGNVIGRYPADDPNAPSLLLGSHLDSVVNAGKYDGPLGVLVGLACVEQLAAQNKRLPFTIEVLGFADEEGVRYHTTYLGSRSVAGLFDPALLDRCDHDGISMAEAIRQSGGDPTKIPLDAYDAKQVLGYCEVHIEQGPVLEAEDLPIGVVTAIAGQTRLAVQVTGVAGHAGTVPMTLRQDALCATAELILLIEQIGRKYEGLVATVGSCIVHPNASNVIPSLVQFSIDIRHQIDAVRLAAVAEIEQQAQQIAQQRQVGLSCSIVQENQAVPCQSVIADQLAQAVTQCGYPLRFLTSGAGHDGVIISQLAPIAMLFVRCKGGVSHNPAESVETEDVAVAIEVLRVFVERLGDSITNALLHQSVATNSVGSSPR
jgi:allantoate deiminase